MTKARQKYPRRRQRPARNQKVEAGFVLAGRRPIHFAATQKFGVEPLERLGKRLRLGQSAGIVDQQF